MIEEAVRGVAHRPDERELVRDLSEVRKKLRHLHPRHLRFDRLEDALDVGRNIFLRVPEIQVTGSTLEVDQDDALGLAPSGATGVLPRGILGRGEILHLQDLGQTEAQNRRAAYPKQLATS